MLLGVEGVLYHQAEIEDHVTRHVRVIQTPRGEVSIPQARADRGRTFTRTFRWPNYARGQQNFKSAAKHTLCPATPVEWRPSIC